MKISASLLLAASGLPVISAWGTLGHETIAYIATNFVTTSTETYFQAILGDTSADFLASVATWADSYRYTTAGTFSKPYHYIDANDSPPSSCSVNLDRDCGKGGCVVSAINNYTIQVQSSSVSTANRAIAAKMIIHFIGDIHQPLHDEALDVGGNTVSVTFNGTSTNLHAVWDTSIPEKFVAGYSLADAKSWATTLTTAIHSGAYKSSASGWLSGMNLKDPVASSLIWAGDSNAYVCSAVIPDGVSAVEGNDLSGAYYDKTIPIVQEQVAKAGYRLAAWLNLIANGSTDL